MALRGAHPEPASIGATIRRKRIEVLNLGLREMARALGIAPAHLSDLEHGRRSPSEELLLKLAKLYKLDESILRSGWSKPDAVVREIASQNPMTAAKVPALLRSAKGLTSDQWDALITEAKRLSRSKR